MLVHFIFSNNKARKQYLDEIFKKEESGIIKGIFNVERTSILLSQIFTEIKY
jgi:hypothetical protein